MKEMKRLLYSAIIILSSIASVNAVEPEVAPSYAWRALPTLGTHQTVEIDTLLFNYAQKFVPSAQASAYATTGNFGGPGETLIFFSRKPCSDFFFRDAISNWIPSAEKMAFYNTRIPMTLLAYNFGGSKQTAQDRLSLNFSGNATKQIQVGVIADYLHSKGSYANQSAKNLTWGLSGSYIGDRYQFQGYYYHYNIINLENGGIEDDLYITDPAEIQGGITSVDTKIIPTRLTQASSRVVGGQLFLNNKYNLGFYRDVELEEFPDSIVTEFVPVTSIIWTLDYRAAHHNFNNRNSTQNKEFWRDTYFTPDNTFDRTSYWSIRNTFGISLLEGFNKYAKAGLSAYLTHEYRHFRQTLDPDTLSAIPETLEPLNFIDMPGVKSQNLLYVGAQLSKQQGKLLTYDGNIRFGLLGDAIGEVKASGLITAHIPLLKREVDVTGFIDFSNEAVPYLLRQYISNHFVWNNNFGKTRRLKFGGSLAIPSTYTSLTVGVENLQNLVYFDNLALPAQARDNIQVFSASLNQAIRYRAFNWENRITFQTTSNSTALPLPSLSIYSNLYFYFKIARVLQVQFGIDCDYYTRYKAVSYQPATMAFYNQNEIDCGNYPFMNLYCNMKLGRARFYLMMSHINQGLTGKNYFSMPHYPLNPRRFQLGVSIDFLN